MFVITGKSHGEPPFAMMDKVNDDIDNVRRICRSIAGLPNTEHIGLYQMDDLGALALVESWTHEHVPANSDATMPIAKAQSAAKPRKRAGVGKDTPETSQTLSERAAGFEGYCVKCRDKREFDGKVELNKRGRRVAKGNCPVCGTKMNRMLANV